MPGKIVGTRYSTLRPTAPAGTLATAPASASITVGNVILAAIEIVIPRGHNGLTGVQVLYAGQRILPFGDAADFFSGDDDDDEYPVDIEVSSPIVVKTYNVDIYEHVWLLRFKVIDFATPSTPPVRAIPLAVLNGN